MRSWIKVGELVLVGAVALLVTSCGESTQSRHQGGQPAPDTEFIEDSGKRISGEFVLSVSEDAYRAKNAQAPPQSILSFDENGNFKRQDRVRVEEGTYLIGRQSELVIYIEKVNGDLLGEARMDRYVIVDQNDDSVTLQNGPSRTLILKKR